ncbi:MAG: recombinase family protein [Sphingobium sp.]|nr:recombinase family protein [Sphingobium sp.]
MKTVRCAIYTRKSSEEGLAQDFNSLDAQREACSAYILSQASEGWVEVAERYDDGGLSGGTLERPALQRLLADVAEGRIDIIVVYKVDRLTRSLLDFAKLVEALDKTGTSFVSITQSFNTTTSMGRLTLNMLLSFAQFEREVTAERIRDKIAASKARGMWMGGIPPLGYRPDGRSLAVVAEHAAIVRAIFERYLDIGNVRLLAETLEREGLHAPVRHTASGKSIGGRPFSRGQLYLMLKCRTYLGEVQHKEHVYPGLHMPIIDRELWDRIRARLEANLQGHRSGARASSPALLAGRIVDGKGEPLISSHAVKGKTRYRYYISQAKEERGGATTRVPAREIEAAVSERIAQALDDPLGLMIEAGLPLDHHMPADMEQRAKEAAARARRKDPVLVRQLVTRVAVGKDRVAIHCATSQIATLLMVELDEDTTAELVLTAAIRLTRSGRAMRLIHDNGQHASATPDPALVRIVVQAQRWWTELSRGEVNITMLCAREKVSDAWMTRVLRLAFLSPKVMAAILAGRQPASLNTAALLGTGAVPACWRQQEKRLLAP